MDEIIIREKKQKNSRSLITASILFCACIYLFFSGFGDNGFFYLILGALGLLYFGVCVIRMIVAAVREPVLLILRKDDAVVSMGGGKLAVPYAQMEKAETFRAMGQIYLGIWIREEKAWEEGLSLPQRSAVQSNLRIACPPICVRMGEAKGYTPQEVLELVKSRIPEVEEESNKPRSSQPNKDNQ